MFLLLVAFVFIFLRLLSHEERRKGGEEKKEDMCSIKKDFLTDDDPGFVTPATGTCNRQNSKHHAKRDRRQT